MLLVKLVGVSRRLRRAFWFWIISLPSLILLICHFLHLGQYHFDSVIRIYKIYLLLSHLLCNKCCILLSAVITVIPRMLWHRLLTVLLIFFGLALFLCNKILYLTCFFLWCRYKRIRLCFRNVLRLISFVLGSNTQVDTLLLWIDFVVLNNCSDYLSNIFFIHHSF
jgi:hypothetical protein